MLIDRKAIKRLAEEFGLELVILFGSEATKNTHKKSDVDIAFIAPKPVDNSKLYERLIKLLNRADVDLIDLKTTHNHYLRYKILKEGELLYEKEKGAHSKRLWQSFTDFCDFKRYYEMKSNLVRDKVRAL